MSFEDVKVGDKFIRYSSGYDSKGTFTFVERLTKTQIVMRNGEKFRKSDGQQVGNQDAWSSVWLVVPTEENVAKVLLSRKRRKVMEILTSLRRDLKKLPESTLDQVLKLKGA